MCGGYCGACCIACKRASSSAWAWAFFAALLVFATGAAAAGWCGVCACACARGTGTGAEAGTGAGTGMLYCCCGRAVVCADNATEAGWGARWGAGANAGAAAGVEPVCFFEVGFDTKSGISECSLRGGLGSRGAGALARGTAAVGGGTWAVATERLVGAGAGAREGCERCACWVGAGPGPPGYGIDAWTARLSSSMNWRPHSSSDPVKFSILPGSTCICATLATCSNSGGAAA
jgi:hypothetical protein